MSLGKTTQMLKAALRRHQLGWLHSDIKEVNETEHKKLISERRCSERSLYRVQLKHGIGNFYQRCGIHKGKRHRRVIFCFTSEVCRAGQSGNEGRAVTVTGAAWQVRGPVYLQTPDDDTWTWSGCHDWWWATCWAWKGWMYFVHREGWGWRKLLGTEWNAVNRLPRCSPTILPALHSRAVPPEMEFLLHECL